MRDKGEVINYIWQYSRFYGNQLGSCERYYQDGEGYAALVILFEITENICKSLIEDYESSFYNIVSDLREKEFITEDEEKFLSTDEDSIRKMRNLFAHADLNSISIVENENGKDIYYPLTEEESCLFLYKKISDITLNILLRAINNSNK